MCCSDLLFYSLYLHLASDQLPKTKTNQSVCTGIDLHLSQTQHQYNVCSWLSWQHVMSIKCNTLSIILSQTTSLQDTDQTKNSAVLLQTVQLYIDISVMKGDEQNTNRQYQIMWIVPLCWSLIYGGELQNRAVVYNAVLVVVTRAEQRLFICRQWLY